MRKTVFLLLLSSLALGRLHAQDSLPTPRHIVKLNVLAPIFYHLELGYEHMLLKGRASAGINLSGYNMPNRPFWFWGWTRMSGAGVGVQFRVYSKGPFTLGKKLRTWSRGLYVSPELRVNVVEAEYRFEDGTIDLLQTSRTAFTECFVGLNVGLEFAIARRFIVDLFTGLGYNGILKGDPNESTFVRDQIYPGYVGMKPRGGLRVGLAF